MDQQKIAYLHRAYLDGSLTSAEYEEWQSYLNDSQSEASIKEMMDATWHSISPEERIILERRRSDLFFESIVAEPVVRKISPWPRIAVAIAAAVAMLALCIYFFSPSRSEELRLDYALAATDIAPGSTGATLTLADGHEIQLSEEVQGEIATQGAISIRKTGDGQLKYQPGDASELSGKSYYNKLSTAKGQTYQLILPDGSQVWMNAESSISFSSKLIQNGMRHLKLTGEAYFEIAKDSAHPFVIESEGQELRVLGTHFNVHAYPDDAWSRSTLLEGSIRIHTKEGQQVLKVGQQALVSKGKMKVVQADAEEVMAWKNGYFFFNDASAEEVMKSVARWYDVEIVYEMGIPDIRFTGVISREKSMLDMLRLLQKTKDIHFKIEGRRIKVME